MSYSTQDSTPPLSYFLTLGQQGRLDDLQEEKAHIILLDHLLHHIIYLLEPSLHQLFNLRKFILYPFHENMGKVLVIITEKSYGLFAC